MNRPVVALLTNSLSGGGAERAATTLANALAATGVVEPVLVPGRTGDADLVDSDVEIMPLGKDPGSGIGGLRGTLPEARRVLQRLKPDVVHAHCELPELLALALTPRGARLVVTEHARTPWSEHPAMGRAVRRGLVLRRTTWVVPQPELPVWSLPRARPHLVANPLLDVSARWAPHSGPGPLRVVAVGRLVALKRFDWLVRAAAALSDRITVTLIGDGPERAALEALTLSLRAPVTLTGYHPDPWAAALQHDVYVTPSSTEADPLSLAEAVLHEMPVLASDLPSHRGQGLATSNLFRDEAGLHAALVRAADDRDAGGLTRLVAADAAAHLRSSRSAPAVARAQLCAYGLG